MKKILQTLLQICLVASLCVPGKVLYASDLDDRIESSAKESYVFKSYLKDENIHIQSKEGVKNVINEITTAPVAMNPDQEKLTKKVDTDIEYFDDASITTMARTNLLYHRSTNALNIIITTNDGVIKLEGNVKNAAEKELAAKLVSDVHGVKGIVNNMTIN
jgi:hyperosmotically inducible protein